MPNTNPTSDINPHDIYDYLKDDIDVFCNNVPSLVNDIITQYNIDINSEYNPLCDPIVIQSYIANHIKELLSDLHHKLLEYFNIINIYDDETLKMSMVHYCMSNINHLIFRDIASSIKVISNTHIVRKLAEIPLPPQRSAEWFEMRTHMLTASSLADAMGKGHFNTRNQTLLDKCFGIRESTSFGNSIMQHGVKYEEVATALYERKYGVKIREFGLLPHPTLKCFGASPDGIVDCLESGTTSKEHVGRMLEIKCPPKREITDETPWHYWTQVQGQLEVTGLDEADFLQVKIVEYNSTDAFSDDNLVVNGIIVPGKDAEGADKGCVISYRDTDNPDSPVKYLYSDYGLRNDVLINWRDAEMDKIIALNKDIVEFKFWHVTVWSCVLIKRDQEWFKNTATPEILRFWNDVVYWRGRGSCSLVKSIADEKQEKIDKRNAVKKEKEALVEAKRVEKARVKAELKEQKEKKKEEKKKDDAQKKYTSPKPTESILLDDIDKLNL
jgi:putative phage-type endonuclease